MTSKRRVVGTSVVLISAVIAACLAPHLSMTDQEAVVTTPMLIDFGPIATGATSGPQTITVSPASGSGSSNDTVTGFSESCSDFTVIGLVPRDVFRHCGSGSGTTTADATGDPSCPDPVTIQTAELVATFHPVVAGAASCSVQINGTFGTQTVLLQGTGTAPESAIEVSPLMIDFGDVRKLVTSTAIPLTVRNAGTKDLVIDSVSISVLPNIFTITGNTGTHLLGANTSETFVVTCTPQDTVSYAGAVTVASNAANAATMTIPLSCRGTDSALQVLPSPVDLDTRVGEPIQRTVTITNTGAAVASITAFAVSGPELSLAMAPALPLNLNSGAPTTVRVAYAATTVRAKTSLGKLTITHNMGTTDEVILSAEALATSIAVNPDAIDFGPVCAGSIASVGVNVFANAAGSFTVSSVTQPVAPFALIAKAGEIPALVRGGHANDLAFTARVMPATAGVQQSQAVLNTDMPGMPARTVSLRVEALAAGVAASPQLVDFGAIGRDTTSPVQRVQLTNCGAGELMVTGVHVEGPAASDFAVVSPADPTRTLAATASMEFLIVMTPRIAGAKVATLVVEYAGGTATTDLVGAALGGADDGATRRETYYRCSAGGAAGLGPIGLAVVAVLRRRRRRS